MANFIAPLLAVVLAIAALSAGAGDTNVPPEKGAVLIDGAIKATQGNRLNPKAATLTTGGKTYRIQLDEKGRSLVGVMSGERAEIWAVPFNQDGTDWLRVLGYPDARLTAGHELWRHMRCVACVVTPAVANAAVPRDLHGATAVSGRYWPYREKFTAWTRDKNYLWLASDSRLLQIDLAEAKVIRAYGKSAGMPERLVYSLTSDGRRLWIVHQGGVATLPVGADTIAPGPAWLAAPFASVVADSQNVWIASTSGTFQLPVGTAPGSIPPPDPKPALPTAARIARTVEGGIWIPHWQRRTSHFMADAIAIGGKLLMRSYGDIYALEGLAWKKLVDGGWALQAAAGQGWFLSTEGLHVYDPTHGTVTLYPPPEQCRGEAMHLLVDGDHVWLASHPFRAATDKDPIGGGLSLLDLKTGKWQTWTTINGQPSDRISSLAARDGAVWAIGAKGHYQTRGAHPGMTYVKHKSFVTSEFQLHRFDGQTWQSFPLKIDKLGTRLICGQDGCRDSDGIYPRVVSDLSVGPGNIFAQARLVPGKYFGGYWPSVVQLAARTSPAAPWTVGFTHQPEGLGLLGEQPLVLNISYGEILREVQARASGVMEAVGHDNVLALFRNGATAWTVSEGAVARYDQAAGNWRRVVDAEYRFYWRATAALRDGPYLFIGSDRGLISRLELATGQFDLQLVLDDREITRLAKNAAGRIVAESRPAPLGTLPAALADTVQPVQWESAVFDGRTWAKATAADLPTDTAALPWTFRQIDKKERRDKSDGNFLFPAKGQKPVLYVKDVFYPKALLADEGRLWISTYTGLLAVPFDATEEPKQ